MKNVGIKDLQKGGEQKKAAPALKEDVKKSVSDIFREELDEEQKEIFEQIKSILINKRDKHEFEAVTEKNLDDYALIIEYVQNGIFVIDEDGVTIKLRKPLKNMKGEIMGDEVKVLFDRNESRELALKSTVLVPERSKSYQEAIGTAVICASLAKHGNQWIGLNSFAKIRKENHNDYILIINVYSFFRS